MPVRAGSAAAKDAPHAEDRLLVELEVLVVGERQPLEHREQPGQVADRAPGVAARELEDVGVLLLRHPRRARREGVGQRREAELVGREDDEVLPEAREVDEQERRREEVLGGGVAVGDGVERVRGGPRKPRLRARASRSTASGVPESAPEPSGHSSARDARVVEAARVAAQHLDVGEAPVAEGDGLGALQVRVARHRRGGLGFRAAREREREGARGRRALVEGVLQVEAEVGRDLVVPRAARVELPRERARPSRRGAPRRRNARPRRPRRKARPSATPRRRSPRGRRRAS